VNEQIAQANGIEIAYETFGEESDPTLLLVMGLGVQMLGWDERFCGRLADRGFRVVRFDNRDVGRSTHFSDAPPPDLMAGFGGDTSSAAYTLDDMADDAAGLLDHLGVDGAHVVGVSLGGMIAQTLAVRHPERVLSLTSIMSTTGAQTVGQPREEVLPVLLTPPPPELEGFAEFTVGVYRTIGSPGYPPDDDALRALARASYERSYDPLGVGRQLMAVLASGDRTPGLGSIRAPTVVIHGEEDPLIQVSGGDATAKAIPDAKLVRIPGMGHDLPEPLWDTFIDEIAENAAQSEPAA
jgi:pimeloyl-ACP methyl ester carboxylesterase